MSKTVWLLALLSTASAATIPVFQRGFNLTAEFPAGYASETARETLRMLPAWGVNSIALVPYGRLNSPQPFGDRGMEGDSGIEQLTKLAHTLHMRVMLKPQLWGRTWPADFDPGTDSARREWFDKYESYIIYYAKLATRIHADLFCVGTELSKMTRHPQEWRRIIAHVRKEYTGALTYAAVQGPEFETLSFWDALDYIGLSNYYPLPDSLDATSVLHIVEAVQRKYKKPVIFPEAGFSSFAAPHKEPWSDRGQRISMDEQARCYDALMRAFYKQPWFQGVYWWKMGTNQFGGPDDGSHTPWRKPAMDIVKRWFMQGGR